MQFETRRNISTQRRRDDVRGTQRADLSGPTGAGCPMLPSVGLSTFAPRLCVEKSRPELNRSVGRKVVASWKGLSFKPGATLWGASANGRNPPGKPKMACAKETLAYAGRPFPSGKLTFPTAKLNFPTAKDALAVGKDALAVGKASFPGARLPFPHAKDALASAPNSSDNHLCHNIFCTQEGCASGHQRPSGRCGTSWSLPAC